MEDSKKKLVMVVVIVSCLALAGIITFKSRESADYGDVPKNFTEQSLWMKCTACNAGHEMNKKEYYEFQQKNPDPKWMGPTPLFCEKCNEQTVYKAVKCEKCEDIFKEGVVVGKLPDTCPECGFSKSEERRKLYQGGK